MFQKLVFFCLLLISFDSFAKTEHQIHFENTDHELHVYKIYGQQPGKTLLIIGGMHNEPGGYVAADLFADVKLKKGNLIVVPRANMPAVVTNKRAINGDMNRTFDDHTSNGHQHTYEHDIVAILKELIKESDALLNLHDGSGFYRPTWQSELENPKRWGQSIITDRATFTSNKTGEVLQLAARAKRVVDKVNTQVDNPQHIFHYKNTKTKDPDSIHKEQRQSATFYALYEQNVESYGIETSKNIRSLDTKVTYQTMIINAFMDEYNIEIDNQLAKLPQPKLDYLLISRNGQRPQGYKNGEVLNINAGDTITVKAAFTNYQRGVTVDVENYNGLNDIDKPIIINEPTTVRVLKDKYLAGSLYVNTLATNQTTGTQIASQQVTNVQVANAQVANVQVTGEPRQQALAASSIEPAHLVIEINGKTQKLNHGDAVSLLPTDILKLVSYQNQIAQRQASQINFVGFVGNKKANDGEDRGYEITLAKLIKRFSLHGEGKKYRIKAEQGKQTLAQFYVNYDG